MSTTALLPRQPLQYRAIGPSIPGTGVDQITQRSFHRLQIRNFFPDFSDMLLGGQSDIRTGAFLVAVKGKQVAALFDSESQPPRACQKA